MQHAPRLLSAAARPGDRGGIGSGKSTIAKCRPRSAAATDRASCSSRTTTTGRSRTCPTRERASVNYDHPDALELDLLTSHLDAAPRRASRSCGPTYDFTIHDRAKEGLSVEPAPVIVVEGILVLADERAAVALRGEALRRYRFRHPRDAADPAGSRAPGPHFRPGPEAVLRVVRPMHLAFVEPSKRFADVIIPEGGQNRVALDFLLSFVRQRAAEGG